MRINSLKKEIYLLAKYNNGWLNGAKFEELAMNLGYKASNGSRRCRQMVEEGLLERRLNDKRCVEYRWKEPKQKTEEEKVNESEELLRQAML